MSIYLYVHLCETDRDAHGTDVAKSMEEQSVTHKTGGEGGIRPIECGALYRVAWPCSDTGNKALIGISASARSYRCVLNANSHGGCSTAMENVAGDCSFVTSQFSC